MCLYISLVDPYFFMTNEKGEIIDESVKNGVSTELIAEMGKFKITILNRE